MTTTVDASATFGLSPYLYADLRADEQPGGDVEIAAAFSLTLRLDAAPIVIDPPGAPAVGTWTSDQSQSGARVYTGAAFVEYEPPVAGPPAWLDVPSLHGAHVVPPELELVDGRPT